MIAAIKKKLIEFNRDITGVASPLVLGLFCIIIFGFNESIFKLLPIYILNEIFCSLIKYFYFKPRPLPEVWGSWYEKIQASSFPSIHSARMGVLISFFYDHFNISFNNLNFQFVAIILLSFFVLGSRIVLKKHDIFDVVFGLIIGVLVSFSILNLY